MKEQNEEQQQQREKLKKFLLVLPFIIVLFSALGFLALGGGKDNRDQQDPSNKGINTELPEAQFKNEKQENKLSLYDQAAKDSVRMKNNAANPLFSLAKTDTSGINSSGRPAGMKYGQSADANAARINQKLAQINQIISRPEPATPVSNPATQNSPETDKLEKMLKSVNTKNTNDPEMQQLNGMLDKIMAIQNPDLAQQKPKPGQPVKKDSAFKAIPAVIEGNQKVAQGGVVKLRLLDTIVLKNVTIPKGQLLFGSCNITNQRLILDIKNIRLGTSIIPVDLSVFSLDGLLGINAPEAELGQAAGSGTDNALQSMEFLPMDQSLTTQAASAGITAAKGLIGKKVKRIKVRLKNGQAILLRNNQPDKY